MQEKTEASVAETLARAHAALLEDLKKLEEAVSPASKKTVGEINARLAATRAHIVEHFRFEERNGYMDIVRNREPRLEHAIEQLGGEHRQLLQSLDAVIEKTKTASKLDDALREEVARWLHGVRDHEMRENDLVQDAFIQDLAAED